MSPRNLLETSSKPPRNPFFHIIFTCIFTLFHPLPQPRQGAQSAKNTLKSILFLPKRAPRNSGGLLETSSKLKCFLDFFEDFKNFQKMLRFSRAEISQRFRQFVGFVSDYGKSSVFHEVSTRRRPLCMMCLHGSVFSVRSCSSAQSMVSRLSQCRHKTGVGRLCIVVPHRMEHRFLARLTRKT